MRNDKMSVNKQAKENNSMAYQLNASDLDEFDNTPRGLSQTNANQGAQTAPNDSYLRQAFVNFPMRLAGDVGAGLATEGNRVGKTALNLAQNLLAPESTIPVNGKPLMSPWGDALPNNPDFSSALGVSNPNWADKMLQYASGVAPFAPLASEAVGASALEGASPLVSKLLEGGLTGALHGATQENPVSSALGEGAGFALGEGAIKGIPMGAAGLKSLASSGMDLFKPQKYAEGIMNNLSGGQSVTDNMKSLADTIHKNYTDALEKSNQQYSAIFKTGDMAQQPIYGSTPNGIGGENKIPGLYDDFLKEGMPFKDKQSLALHNAFMNNPTLDNAHELQKSLGANIGALQRMGSKSPLPQDAADQLENYKGAQDALKQDIFNSLQQNSPETANAYLKASEDFKNNVVPYRSDPDLYQIAKGKIENPSATQMYSIFRNPENQMLKVADDLGEDGRNQLLYAKFGKINPQNINPASVLKKFSGLDSDGFSEYVNNSLQDQINALGRRMTAKYWLGGAALTSGYKTAKNIWEKTTGGGH